MSEEREFVGSLFHSAFLELTMQWDIKMAGQQ
jgi:hypothetical protein